MIATMRNVKVLSFLYLPPSAQFHVNAHVIPYQHPDQNASFNTALLTHVISYQHPDQHASFNTALLTPMAMRVALLIRCNFCDAQAKHSHASVLNK